MGNKIKNRKDFSTRRQIERIISSAPNIGCETIRFTKLNGGGL